MLHVLHHNNNYYCSHCRTTCVKDLSEKTSERERERERMRDCESKSVREEKEREKSEKRLYNHSNLVKKKKSIISSTLYHSVILAFIRAFEFLASRRLFLYRDFCPSFHPPLFSYSVISFCTCPSSPSA